MYIEMSVLTNRVEDFGSRALMHYSHGKNFASEGWAIQERLLWESWLFYVHPLLICMYLYCTVYGYKSNIY